MARAAFTCLTDTFRIDMGSRLLVSKRAWLTGTLEAAMLENLHHQIGTYQTIRERIIALEADIDDVTLADTLEGLTDLHEVIAAVVRSAVVDEAMADGLKGHISTLQE